MRGREFLKTLNYLDKRWNVVSFSLLECSYQHQKINQGSYTCRATNALTKIEAKVKVNSPVTIASCYVIRKQVSSVSGNYVIDSDGEGGAAPFTVYCDMADKNGVGVTVISHDSESRTKVRDGLGWGD